MATHMLLAGFGICEMASYEAVLGECNLGEATGQAFGWARLRLVVE